tara:strand:- start:408 stop:800 length:393 start_codon:yes stop_codon:yes gene_type:complete
MVIDTSAILAVMLHEEDNLIYANAIRNAGSVSISAGTLTELGVVLTSRLGRDISPQIDAFVARAGFIVEPVTEPLARSAWSGYLRYGKGLHPAGLNFGDCFAYALAKERGEPLLYKGNDFSRTDIQSALA